MLENEPALGGSACDQHLHISYNRPYCRYPPPPPTTPNFVQLLFPISPGYYCRFKRNRPFHGLVKDCRHHERRYNSAKLQKFADVCLVEDKFVPPTIERFHMTSRRPYWCSKTMKRQPCWCTKPVLWELNSFLM